MPVYCVAPNCHSTAADRISHFKFPKDKELQKKWLSALNCEGYCLSPYAAVCVKHFNSSDVIQEGHAHDNGTGKSKIVKRKHPRLKPGSVPIHTQGVSERLLKQISRKRKRTANYKMRSVTTKFRKLHSNNDEEFPKSLNSGLESTNISASPLYSSSLFPKAAASGIPLEIRLNLESENNIAFESKREVCEEHRLKFNDTKTSIGGRTEVLTAETSVPSKESMIWALYSNPQVAHAVANNNESASEIAPISQINAVVSRQSAQIQTSNEEESENYRMSCDVTTPYHSGGLLPMRNQSIAIKEEYVDISEETPDTNNTVEPNARSMDILINDIVGGNFPRNLDVYNDAVTTKPHFQSDASTNDDTEEDLYFFKSILTDLKNVPRSKKAFIRLKIQELIYNQIYDNGP